jgi:Tfp pilus assembly protein PilP
MRTALPTRALLALCLAALAAPGLAQSPAPAASPAADAPTATLPSASDTVKSILDEELAPAPGAYTYSSQGRRDPFVSLLKPVGPDSGPAKRRPGMEGFLIQEVALKGIVRDRTGYIAILLGTDGKSYFVRNGQRLYDGVVTAIDAASVTFRQEITDPLSTVKSRDVRKSLYPSEEGR